MNNKEQIHVLSACGRKRYTKVFCIMLKYMEFSLGKQEDGRYRIIDNDPDWYGYYDNVDSAENIVKRFSQRLNYYFDGLKDVAETECDLDKIDAPKTAEDWVQFMEKHEDFKRNHQYVYEMVKLISSPEILHSINLDDVVHYFNPDVIYKKEEQKFEKVLPSKPNKADIEK